MNLCLAGLVAAVRCTSLLGMDMLRGTFVTTVARFTQLHAPASMAPKHAQAFRALLVIADENGNHLGVRGARVRFRIYFRVEPRGMQGPGRAQASAGLLCAACIMLSNVVHSTPRIWQHIQGCGRRGRISQGEGLLHERHCCSPSLTRGVFCAHPQNVWQEVLRCVSRWELLQQIASGGPTDAHLFAAPAQPPPSAAKRRPFFSMRRDAGARACVWSHMHSPCLSTPSDAGVRTPGLTRVQRCAAGSAPCPVSQVRTQGPRKIPAVRCPISSELH